MITVWLYCSCLHLVMYGFYSLPLASSVISLNSFKYSFPNNISEPYNVTVTCIIHPDSTADYCEVRARADDRITTYSAGT